MFRRRYDSLEFCATRARGLLVPFLLLSFFCLQGPFAQESPSEETRINGGKLDRAFQFFQQGEFRRTVEVLGPVEPDDELAPEIAGMLALSYYGLGDCESAIPFLRIASAAGQEKPELSVMLAVCHDILGNSGERDLVLTSLGMEVAETASYYVFRGDTWANRGDLNKAIGDYQRALQIDPKLRGVPYRLGVLYSETHAYERAGEAFRQELQINPNHAAAAYSLGAYYLVWERDLPRAEMFFRSSIESNPDHLPGYLGLMRALLSQDRAQEALKIAREAEQRNLSAPELYHLKSRAFRRLGRKAEAEEAVNQYLKTKELSESP